MGLLIFKIAMNYVQHVNAVYNYILYFCSLYGWTIRYQIWIQNFPPKLVWVNRSITQRRRLCLNNTSKVTTIDLMSKPRPKGQFLRLHRALWFERSALCIFWNVCRRLKLEGWPKIESHEKKSEQQIIVIVCITQRAKIIEKSANLM